MARAAPHLSLVITMLGAIVVLCGGLVVAMKYGEVQIKEAEKIKDKNKKPEPTGPYAARIKALSPKQHAVTQLDEDDLTGLYAETSEPGLYLDLVSDEVLFSSRDKLLPAFNMAEFSRPVDEALLIEEPEIVNGQPRIRVKSKKANTRLGWKGPDQENKTRYFLNSTALRFVPAADLDKEGLGPQRKLLENP